MIYPNTISAITTKKHIAGIHHSLWFLEVWRLISSSISKAKKLTAPNVTKLYLIKSIEDAVEEAREVLTFRSVKTAIKTVIIVITVV